MSPIIITDKNNNVEMVIGAAGGVRIITGVSLVTNDFSDKSLRIN